MIEIEALEFGYPGGRFQLQIPAMTLEPGERLAIVGPSGTGKTTLLNLVAGIFRPDSGQIRVNGVNLGQMPENEIRKFRSETIGFVFQDFALLDYLTARENILYSYRIAPALKLNRGVRARAEALADACGLADKLDQRPRTLSQGEQQRIAICRALITEPALVLSDEATGNLDPDNKSLILDLLFEQTRSAGASVLAVTHDHDLLERFDRTIDFTQFRCNAAA